VEPARFLVGIDLGTVNTALAAVDLAAGGDPAAAIRAEEIPQVVAPGEVRALRLLPSAVYLPGPEWPRGAGRLPWDGPGGPGSHPSPLPPSKGSGSASARRRAEPGSSAAERGEGVAEVSAERGEGVAAVDAARGEGEAGGGPAGRGEREAGLAGEPGGEEVVGEAARAAGARVPGRVILSAKSWLAHPRADRTAPILPWGAAEGVPRRSPVDASARLLAHLAAAWGAGHPGAPLAAQEVKLAVPASFDAAARALTLEAAARAGLRRVSLVEEPAAAFHDWASRNRADLEAALGGARLVLVVDVGGGTTDLTLVAASLEGGRPAFTRLAVGDHLLLGGDNADLALARAVEARAGARLDPARFAALVYACRGAKERLLAGGGPARETVAVAGRGAGLVGSAFSAELTADEVRRTVIDGFFPEVPPDARPRRAPRTAGLAELGLPYESDPAVTRHVAAFLAAHAGEVGSARDPATGLARPDAILVNGGMFTPREVRERLAAVVGAWFPGGAPVRLLASPALDLAVARGAAYAALVGRGLGLRLGGGTARAYYVGVAAPEGERALCVVPRHLEEGSRVEVPRPFTLATGVPVRFPLWASSAARLEQPGDLVEVGPDLQPLPAVEAVLPPAPGAGAGGVPVRLEALLTEIGTLELSAAAAGGARYRLEFALRGEAGARAGEARAAPRALDPARALVDRVYGKKAAGVDPREAKDLVRALEKLLGPRDGWETALVRELWGALHAGRARRRRSAEHERAWLQLTGFTLRPGFGAPLDAWRAAETFQAWGEGLQYQGDPRAWAAWWVTWRRIAGGLDAAAQERIREAIAPFLRPRAPGKPPPRVPGVKPEALDELVRLAGALERVAPAAKVELGETLLARAETEGAAPHLLWAVGRLGARVPFHASVHEVVPAAVAEAWLERLAALAAAGAPPGALAFPASQLARCAGDRVRDVGDTARARALALLEAARAPEAVLRAVREVVAPSAEDERRVFGDTLPPGLRVSG
jgi:molecular chaperone DnaK (HSP70)